jgi:hypothetical protein
MENTENLSGAAISLNADLLLKLLRTVYVILCDKNNLNKI